MHRIMSIVIMVVLLAGLNPASSYSVSIDTRSFSYAGMFRADVVLGDAYDRARLNEAGIVVLSETANSARVLIDMMQRVQLARWGYQPTSISAVNQITQFAPLLPQSKASVRTQFIQSLRTPSSQRAWAQGLPTKVKQQIATARSVDSDGDGLTDVQEVDWCTNPAAIDSDNDRVSDGAEVAALRAWMVHRAERAPNRGFPFRGTPFLNAAVTNCYDNDQDAVPDMAEIDLGLDPNRESSDGDKFDDGQELYGRTYCANSAGFCGYGSLPRNSDFGVIMAEMPAWIKAPGSHPVVAAFPLPEISVKPGSIRVQVVTTITTEKGTMTQNAQSYAQTQTKGVSVAKTDTKTWNKWTEVSESKTTTGRADPITWTAAGVIIAGLGLIAPVVDTVYNVKDYYRQADWRKEDLDRAEKWRKADQKAAKEREEVLDAQFGTHMKKLDKQTDATNLQTSTSVTNTIRITDQMERDTSRLVAAQNDTTFSIDRLGNITANGFRDVTNALLAPRFTKTQSQGESRGGSVSLTQTEYEENSVTAGEVFTTGEDWRTATAVNSAHAADLYFTYTIANVGTDFALELRDMSFNVYLNDDPNPISTYTVATDLGGDGRLTNISPADAPREYTSRRIPLSLVELQALDVSPACVAMKAQRIVEESAVCPGGTIRIEPNGYSYGTDQLFYTNAINAGVTIQIDDGPDDGDQSLESYVVPTWQTISMKDEPLLDVLARAFPIERNSDRSLAAIWTPEMRNDTPSWCESPQKYVNKVYCKRSISTADAWVMYSAGMSGDATAYQDTTAQPSARALFRFRRDSDKDGYPDDVEDRLGTNKYAARSVPNPELTAGLHQVRDGRDVTATLSLLNGGQSDAYGVEAVMIAPDDSISVTNNFVGGGGRVRAYEQLAVGSGIDFNPALTQSWLADGRATPVLSGYYTGDVARTYTFVTQCGSGSTCTVGSGSTVFAWTDGRGASGTINGGAGYQSPNPLAVGAFGLTVAFLSGTINHGQQFSVVAAPPQDTFVYTVNREPYTQPLVAVTTNHTGGWYQSVMPTSSMNIADPNTNLSPYVGGMIYGMDLQIVSNTPVVAGNNTTRVVVNNPTPVTIKNGKVYLEVVGPDGYRTALFEAQSDFPTGPTIVTIPWSTSAFETPYDANQQFIMRVSWTDYQDTIIRRAYRELSNLGVNNYPVLSADSASLTKNLGSIVAGMPAKHSIFLANTGENYLHVYVPPVADVDTNAPNTSVIPMSAVGELKISLDTGNMPVGSFSKNIQIRTSDPQKPLVTVLLTGTITAGSGDTVAYVPDSYKPFETEVYVKGPKTKLVGVTYTEPSRTDTSKLHPVAVFDDLTDATVGRGRIVANTWERLFPQGRSVADAPRAQVPGEQISGGAQVDISQPSALIDTNWVEVCGENCGFEYGNMYGWEQYNGGFSVTGYKPYSGSYCVEFTTSPSAFFQRAVNISQYAKYIDAGFGKTSAGAWIKDRAGEDAAVKIHFFNAVGQDVGFNYNSGWVSSPSRDFYSYVGKELNIPPGTRYILFRIDVIRLDSGNNTDVSVDNVSIQVRMQGNDVGKVVGTVFADINQNTVRDAGESGVAGARVQLADGTEVLTDANGAYQFETVEVGSQRVTLILPSQYTAGSALEQTTQVEFNKNSRVDYAIIPYSSITGSVYLDADADGVKDAGEAGVAGVVLSAAGLQGSSQGDGSYRIDGVPSGSVTVTVAQSNGYAVSSAASVTVTVAPAGSATADFGVLNYTAEQVNSSSRRIFVPSAITTSERYLVRNGLSLTFSGANQAQTTYIDLPNSEYLTVTMELLSVNTVSGNVRVDIGADGSNEWTPSMVAPGRASRTTLAAAINSYMAGKVGSSVSVPVRITSPVAGTIIIYNVISIPKPTMDIALSSVSVGTTRSGSRSVEIIPVNSTRYVRGTVRNTGTTSSTPFSVAAIADVTDFGEWYLGSVLVPVLAVNQTYTVSIPMSTANWEAVTGTVKLIVDPYNGLAESLESNNETSLAFEVTDETTVPGTPTPTASPTVTTTVTRTATQTKSLTPTTTVTRTASNTNTSTATRTTTRTRTQTATRTATRTRTATWTRTATRTRTATWTRTATRTASRTRTATMTRTATRTRTPTRTHTSTRTANP